MSRSVVMMSTINSTQQPREGEEYQELEVQDIENHYMTPNCPQAQAAVISPPSASVNKVSTKLCSGTIFALIVVFFVCAVIVSLVAVVMYSPLVQGSTGAAQESALLARIQQLDLLSHLRKCLSHFK